MTDPSWFDLRDVAHEYGVTYETAKNKIYLEKFPVPTYKVGKRIVVDKEVHRAYFERKRAEGLALLTKSTGS